MIRIKKAGVWVFSILITFGFAGTASAVAPTVNSFTVDPQSISNNYSAALAWDTVSSTGRDLHFSCPLGVTVKKSGGASFPCNTRTAVTGDPVGWEGFTFTNVSGATQNVVVTFYPKDSLGANYDQGAIRRTISIQTSPQPILDFSISSSTVASGAPLTITWKGQDAGGANLQFECTDSVKIRKAVSDIAVLPCGKPGLAADLPISGSLTVYPSNSSSAPASVSVRVFPAIGSGTYDATHSLGASFSVLQSPPPANPSAAEFTSSATRFAPNEPLSLSWKTRDSAAANIRFACEEGLSVFATSGTSTAKLPCGVPAFTPPLSTSGSTTISVKNANNYIVNLSVILLPQDAKGVYLQTNSLSLNLTVLPAGTAPSSAVESKPSSVSTASSASLPPTASVVPQNTITPSAAPLVKSALPKYNFVRPLKRGSK
ncbi:MAG: hypothetical protein NUV88_03665, partial [Candidatus Kaiserbacteria bacterium]|nr:hypothetical protein [Candidatus Kaiserbacteria bacterium]